MKSEMQILRYLLSGAVITCVMDYSTNIGQINKPMTVFMTL